jgi:hypothetical protein
MFDTYEDIRKLNFYPQTNTIFQTWTFPVLPKASDTYNEGCLTIR